MRKKHVRVKFCRATVEEQPRSSWIKHEKPVLKCSGGSYGALKAAKEVQRVDRRIGQGDRSCQGGTSMMSAVVHRLISRNSAPVRKHRLNSDKYLFSSPNTSRHGFVKHSRQSTLYFCIILYVSNGNWFDQMYEKISILLHYFLKF